VTRVLLDTDLAMGAAGSDIDDGFALALALAEPEIEVELVTTVGGNSDVDTSTRLTLELLDRVGRAEVPVVRGAGMPLDPRWRRPPAPGAQAYDESPARSQPAAAALVERVMAEPGQLTIVAIGPLTNVALALMLEPRVAGAVREVVVMGGVYLKHTNVAAMPGEYNFWCDPDAAACEHTAAMRASERRFAPFAGECADGWIDYQTRVKRNDEREHDSCALHDPLAVAVVARPELVEWRPAHVAVETSSPLTRGVAVADLGLWEDAPPPNAQVAVAVDAAGFMAYFLEQIARLP
jgi:purine nucleosidase